MKKSQIINMPAFFDRYIHLAEDIELIDGLKPGVGLFDNYLTELEKVADKRYAPGKWTPRDIIQHITDNERIMAYRALRIGRNDKTDLPGYDEELLADNTNANKRTIADLISEFKLVRQSNIILFENLNDEMLLCSAFCNKVEVSALALGFVLTGHQIHHLNVMKERYFNL